MKTFHGTFNWYGEIHEVYSTTTNISRARLNMLATLASKLKRSVGSVVHYFPVNSVRYIIKYVGSKETNNG